MFKFLLVEDVPEDAKVVELVLRKEGLQFSLRRVSTKDEMEKEFRGGAPDLILAEYSLPSFNGIAALRIARVYRPEVPFIFVSRDIDEERAVDAIKMGATDFIFKQNLTRLGSSVKRAIRESAERAIARDAEKARDFFLARQGQLLSISLEILAETTLDSMVPRITRSACQLTGSNLGMVIYGIAPEPLKFFASAPDGVSLPVGRGMLQVEKAELYLKLLGDSTSLRLTDKQLRSHAGWRGLTDGYPHLRGLLCARLTGEDGSGCGMIMVSDKIDGSDFSAEDQALLNQLAAFVSLDMRHLAAQEELQRSHDKLDQRVKERTAELAQSVVALQKEIVERQQVEDELTKSQERYALVAIGANDGIWDWDIKSGQVYFSGRWKSMVGYEEYEIRNSIDEWTKRIHPDDYDGVMAALDDHLSGKSLLYQMEYRMLHKDGNYRWISTRGASFRDSKRTSYRMAGSNTDITEQKQAEEKLLASHENLRNLSSHLEKILEKERTNISREIHDELGQLLTALKFDISWLMKKLPADQVVLTEKTHSMMELIDMTIRTVQRIATELRPRLLYDLGLVTAIEWHAEDFQKRTGIECKLMLDRNELYLDPARSTALFKIFKEALTNVLRHAEASRVDVSLLQRGRAIVMKVKDNGRGITCHEISNPKSVGLIGMKERVHPWGGQLHIKGVAGKGTTLKVTMPVN